MLFDVLCRVIERYVPKRTIKSGTVDIHSMVENARIFHMGEAKRWHNSGPHENLQQCQELFALPFRTTAVEDNLGCIIFHDIEEHAIGMDKPRHFLNFMPVISPFIRKFNNITQEELPNLLKEWKARFNCDYRDCYALNIGEVKREWKEDGTKIISIFAGSLEREIICSRDRILRDWINYPDKSTSGEVEKAVDLALSWTRPGFEQIIEINKPTHFIVEETTFSRNTSNSLPHKILRSVDRPQYLLTTPIEIRKKLGLSDGVPFPGKKRAPLKAPIQRRGHFRYYKANRFREERKTTPQWIKAYWVGPTTGRVGKKSIRCCWTNSRKGSDVGWRHSYWRRAYSLSSLLRN